jgi:hypothetical protein
VAQDLRHVGMFWTITCPSKFHSVGGTNEKYNGATPRDAQAYLVKVWAKMRAAQHRQGIQPYGFRIAEPHSDGCPHWHMLFVAREHAEAMNEIIRAYALAEDGAEAGAEKNRAKLVAIEAARHMPTSPSTWQRTSTATAWAITRHLKTGAPMSSNVTCLATWKSLQASGLHTGPKCGDPAVPADRRRTCRSLAGTATN